MKFGHWELLTYEEDPIPFGFVYRIEGPDGRAYIGKKQTRGRRKLKPLKGKKRVRYKEVESDWRTYTGSCRELNEDIARLGKDQFRFWILQWADSKAELAYAEIKFHLDEDVLLRPEYYNGIVNCRIATPSKPWKRISC